MSKAANERKNGKNPVNSPASLVEALQALCEKMAKAESDAEAEAGLKQLNQIRKDFLGVGDIGAARRDAEALIAWVEERLRQLRQQLAKKRRIQEGKVMEQLAKQREAEGPSLLPKELIDAVVHATIDENPEEKKSTAPKPPAAKKEAERREEKQADEAPEEHGGEEATPGEATPEEPRPTQEPPKQAPPQPAPAEPQKDAPEKKWSRSELLAAHLAASVGEDPRFFDKLRQAAKRKGSARQPEMDDRTAEDYYRSLHDLGKRLVNLELHCKAIDKAKERQEPVSSLLRTAAKELKSFMREFKTAKEARPQLAGEYERRFGGYFAKFSAMKPEKGGELLAQWRAERQPKPGAAARERKGADPAREPERELEAPQLVLKRDDYWQQ